MDCPARERVDEDMLLRVDEERLEEGLVSEDVNTGSCNYNRIIFEEMSSWTTLTTLAIMI